MNSWKVKEQFTTALTLGNTTVPYGLRVEANHHSNVCTITQILPSGEHYAAVGMNVEHVENLVIALQKVIEAHKKANE